MNNVELTSTITDVVYDINRVGTISVYMTIPSLSGEVINIPYNSKLYLNDTVHLINDAHGVVVKEITRNTNSKEILLPTNCPYCNSELNGLKCTNFNCSGVLEKEIIGYLSYLGIHLLTSKYIEKLIDKALLLCHADLYHLTVENLMCVDINIKLAKSIVTSINNTIGIKLTKVLKALDLHGIKYKSLQLKDKTYAEVVDILCEESPLVEETITRDSLNALVSLVKPII